MAIDIYTHNIGCHIRFHIYIHGNRHHIYESIQISSSHVTNLTMTLTLNVNLALVAIKISRKVRFGVEDLI